MYIYDLADIMFFIKSVKFQFKIFDFVEFISGHTRSAGYTNSDTKTASTNSTMNSHFFSYTQIVEQFTNN